MKGRMYMSIKEIDRVRIVERVCKGEMRLSKAAEALDISLRQVKRLKKKYKEEGLPGLLSKKVGAPSNNRLSQEKVNLVLNFLNREEHRDFGPILVHEYLREECSEGFMSASSVRAIMIRYGLWASKQNKSKKIYRLRQRRAQKGELLQLDGSEHAWFEDRGSRCTLIVFVDDATSEVPHLKFVKSENTWDYLDVTREYIEKHGRPCALYPDKHSVFRINREGAISGTGQTQFTRVMEELGIKVICANSPQAKGRVERRNRDFQNRLVKAMRLEKISTIEAGNAFLPAFLAGFNNKFAKAPKNPIDAHKPLPEDKDLDKIFRLKYTRRISKSLTLQFKGVLYQIYADRMEYTLRKTEVTVLEDRDGKVSFEQKGKKLKAVPYDEMEAPVEVVGSKELSTALNEPKKKRHKPGSRHPWKRFPKRPIMNPRA